MRCAEIKDWIESKIFTLLSGKVKPESLLKRKDLEQKKRELPQNKTWGGWVYRVRTCFLEIHAQSPIISFKPSIISAGSSGDDAAVFLPVRPAEIVRARLFKLPFSMTGVVSLNAL